MINYVIINGVNSNTKNGLGINELPPITKPSMRTQTEEIDGRDGDIITKLGYSAYDKTITIGLFGTGYDVNDIISFFTSEGTITFSNEPDKYYKFTMLEQIDVESLLRFKTASITFHCQPFKYPLTETPLEIEYDYIEQTGETLTLNNTGESILDLSLKGNTSQDTTTGTNIIDTRGGTTTTDNQVTFTPTYNSKGELQSIKVNGTASAMSSYAFPNYVTLKAGTYYISKGNINNVRMLLVDSGGSSYVTTGTTLAEESFTLTEDKTVRLWLRVYSGVSIDNAILYPMVATTSGEAYEPYTNGASPNPSYPQPINVVSGDNEVVVCGKNLFDKSKYQNLITDNERAISGYCIKSIQLQPNTQYTISQSAGTTSSVVLLMNKVPNVNDTNYFDCRKTSDTKTYTTDSSGKLYIGCYWNVNDTQCNERLNECNIQIEKGSIATSYEPYQSQTYPINLGELELCKIGDYQDYFTKNTGKNLFDKDNANVLNAYIDTSTQKIKGASNDYATTWIKVKPNTTYTISKKAGKSFRIATFTNQPTINGETYNETQANHTGTSITITTGANDNYIAVLFWSTANGDTGTYQEMLTTLQVEYGSSVSPYEPYGTGLWCKYNAIGEVVYDENTSFAEYNTTTHSFIKYNPFEIKDKSSYSTGTKIPEIVSNYYTSVKWNDFLNGTTGLTLYYANNTLQIRLSSDLTTISDYQNWLSTHNVELLYPLATPYLSLIEDTTLIEQLDNIQNAMSYEGQTNVLQVNNDKPFIISAKALEQGSDEVVVNNIGNATSKPLIALEGTGNINIYLDGTQVLQANVVDKMNIDIDKLEAYNPDTSALLNRQVTGNYNSMTLPSGNSTIKIDGALDKATITNYQRWL